MTAKAMLRISRGFLATSVLAVITTTGCAAGDSQEPAATDDRDGASICVRDVDLELDVSVSDMFDVAPNPFAGRFFGEGDTLALSVSVASGDLPEALEAVKNRHNPFWVRLDEGGGRIVALDRAAAFYAVDWLASELARDHCGLAAGEFTDWSRLEIRALHFPLRRVSLETALLMIDKARQARFNTVIVAVADAVEIRPDIVPLWRNALSRAEFETLVAYARANGLEIIPGLPLLTHQQGFFKKKHPELMYNLSTYDPRNPRVYELVFEFLDELIDVMQPNTILIGHDEVKGLTPASRRQRKWMNEGEQPLPPELFLKDVLILNEFLQDRNLGVWMWGDMLIDWREFREMHKKNFHGIGGYKDLRDKIPENILIADWHYHHETPEFPTIDAFIEAGNDVVGASWKNMNNIRLFAEYVATKGPKARGMIAGTFMHVQRKEWDLVDQIVTESGLRFWQAGKGDP